VTVELVEYLGVQDHTTMFLSETGRNMYSTINAGISQPFNTRKCESGNQG
jgi:hypothetical protein